MPAKKDVVCRNPKCLAKSTVYMENIDPSQPLVFFVFVCPQCSKQVPFASHGCENTGRVPEAAILGAPLQ